MLEGNLPTVSIVFLALAVVFVALAVRDGFKSQGQLTPARKTWIRIAIIFSAVAIGLFVLHTFG